VVVWIIIQIMSIYHLITLSLCLSLSACTAVPEKDNSGIKHVVLCWLKEPGHKEQIEKVINTSRELAVIPGIVEIIAGTAQASDRASVDDSFDAGLIMTFRNASDMNAYVMHEEHVKRVKQVFIPLCQRIQVYDIAY